MAEFSGRERWHFIARAVLSIGLIIPCVYVIIFKANPTDAALKWAIGTGGLVIGYWLR